MPVPLTSSERTAPHAKEMSIFYVAALLLIKTCPLTGSYGCCTSVETLSRNAPRPAPAGVNPTAQAPGQQETVDACCQGAAACRPMPVGLVGPSPSARRRPASAPLPIAGAACPKAGSCPWPGRVSWDLGGLPRRLRALPSRFGVSGARPGVYGLLVKCCAMSLFERS